MSAGLAVTGCSGGGGDAAGQLTIYNGQHEQTTDGLVQAFERQTGISVSVRSEDEGALANLIASVQGAHSPADVIYTENSPALAFLDERHLLSPVDAGTLAAVPARYRAADWVGVSARVSVLIYNPALIARGDLPSTALALADPRYAGKLALAPSETDFQPVVTSMARTYGQARTLQWLRAVKNNAASHIVSDNETVVNDVNRGLVAFGVIDQYYWYRLRAEIGAGATKAQIAFFAPGDPGYVLDVSGAAVLRSSRHRKQAQEFLAFLVSKQGQDIIARAGGNEQSYEYPLAAGVTSSANEVPFQDLRPNPITIAELGDGQAAIALLRQAGLL